MEFTIISAGNEVLSDTGQSASSMTFQNGSHRVEQPRLQPTGSSTSDPSSWSLLELLYAKFTTRHDSSASDSDCRTYSHSDSTRTVSQDE